MQSVKFYSQKGISIATFFGGPLAAGYLIRHNFIQLGKEKEGFISIVLGIISTALLFGFIFSLPENIIDKIPNQLIPLTYTLIIYGIVELIQGKNLKAHKQTGGDFVSNWKATGIGLLGTVFICVLLSVYIFTNPKYSDETELAVQQKMEQVFKNEEKALTFYSLPPDTSKDELIKSIKDQGIFLWNQNLTLLDEVKAFELDDSYRKFVDKLYIYMRLRQEVYLLIYRSLEEETNQYDAEIAQKNKSIEVVMDELEQSSN